MTQPAEDTRSLDLPEGIVERVEDRLPRTEWDMPEAYYVLDEVEVEVAGDDVAADEAHVKERLESLGHLDG